MTTAKPASNVIIIVVGVMFCFVVAACVGAFIAVPEGANTGSLIAILLGSFASTLTSIGVLVQVRQVDQKADATSAQVDKVAADTERLTNGLIPAIVRSSVADVVEPDLIRPDMHDQLARDRNYHQVIDPDRDVPPTA